MSDVPEADPVPAPDMLKLVTLCAWSNTVKHEGEWMTFARYLDRRFGLVTTHGISPSALEEFEREDDVPARDALKDPRRLAALRGTGLLDATPTPAFDRITRLGAAALNVPVTFISLVEDHRDFYLSHCGFGEPTGFGAAAHGTDFLPLHHSA